MEIDPYIIDTLMPDLVGHDRRPAAFLVYLFLLRRTRDAVNGWREITLSQFAEGTGLSKRAVQDALGRLDRRGLVAVKRSGLTAPGRYRVRQPWHR